jgi:uncharacterized repeat protein (TIGR03943 family)
MIPVYMINGFLESGKTQFIKYTLAQPYFQTPGKTLLILCEEGEEEYEDTLLKRARTVVELIEDEADFTEESLKYLQKKVNPERIIIEFNGMWNPKNIKLPSDWKLEQQITTIDAGTFPTFFTNMRSLVAEHVRGSEMIIFNRCDGLERELASYKRNVKAVNSAAEIIFEDKDGEVNVSLEEDLPYDVNADVIELDDKGYAIWYIDIMDNMERYDGKTIEYVGNVLKPPKMPSDMFVPGRMAMTCCAEDMAFLGFICKYAKAGDIPEKEWVKVTAEIKIEENKAYQGMGPVLYAKDVVTVKAPKEPVIDFSKL